MVDDRAGGAQPPGRPQVQEDGKAVEEDRGSGLVSARAAMEAAIASEDAEDGGGREILWAGVTWLVKVRGSGMIGFPGRAGGRILEVTFSPLDAEGAETRTVLVPRGRLEDVSDPELVRLIQAAGPLKEPDLTPQPGRGGRPRGRQESS